MSSIRKKMQGIRSRRLKRVRQRVRATEERPRLSVHRSLKHISGQIIDMTGNVLVSVSDLTMKQTDARRIETARVCGTVIAQKAIEKKIHKVVFDKGSYAYHGRVRAFAEGAREAGLSF